MSSKINSTGKYELFKSTEDNDILHLKRKGWYALIEGQKGEIIVRSDSDHQKQRTLQEGTYYMADFKNDPNFNDVPHLFLEKGKRFKEYILPNGLPTSKDKQKKIITLKRVVSKKKVESHLERKGHIQKDRTEGLSSKTKKELDAIAKEKEVPGRSKMNKADLIKQLEAIA